jgi:hypothetical protein
MTISQSKPYIASIPRFGLARQSRSPIQDGQMTIIYMCLEPLGSVHSLTDLVHECTSRGYKSTFKDPNTDISKSILYHLRLLKEKGLIQAVD